MYLAGVVDGRGSVRLDSVQAGGLIALQNLAIDGGEVSLNGLQVKYGTLQIENAKLSGGDLIFDGVEVSGGRMLLDGIWLEQGSLSFMNMRVFSDALVYLPWGTYGEFHAVSLDSDFDGKSRWKFEREDAHYQPGVVREWGPFAPIN